MKLTRIVTAKAGSESGSMMRKKVLTTPDPSMRAASSKDLGIVSKKPFRFQMVKGSVLEAKAKDVAVAQLRRDLVRYAPDLAAIFGLKG